MLVNFKMAGGGNSPLPPRIVWQEICHNIPGVQMVCQTGNMEEFEAEFRVDGEEALGKLRKEGEVTIINK